MLKRVELHGFSGIGDGIGGAQNLVDALHRGKSALDVVARLGEVFGGIDDAVENHHVVDELGCCDGIGATQNECASKPQHDGDGGSAKKFAHGVGQLVAAVHASRQVAVFFVLSPETVHHLLLGIEGLDDAQSADCLLYIRHNGAKLVLLFKRSALEILAHAAHDKAGNREQDEYKKRQLPAHKEHHRKAHHYHDGVLEHHVERHHHRVLYFGHVTAHACHHVALALAREETYGQRHHLVINHSTQVANHASAQRYHEEGGHIGGSGLQSGHHHQCGSDAC